MRCFKKKIISTIDRHLKENQKSKFAILLKFAVFNKFAASNKSKIQQANVQKFKWNHRSLQKPL